MPPDEVLPVLKTIALNFITERCDDEVVAVGLNAVREVLGRVPAAPLKAEPSGRSAAPGMGGSCGESCTGENAGWCRWVQRVNPTQAVASSSD